MTQIDRPDRPATSTPVDSLDLGPGHALVVREDRGELVALPWDTTADRPAQPGDGTAEALLRRLSEGSRTEGRFVLTGWDARPASGERAVGVDQTHLSVVVGEQSVVKWRHRLEEGPHPAPTVLEVLRRSGFRGTPTPVGLVQWQGPDDAAPRLLVSVDALVPGAVDGWTWAVDDLAEAVRAGDHGPVLVSGTRVGRLVADLHAALAPTAREVTPEERGGWGAAALADLERALEVTTGPAHRALTTRRARLERLVVPPADETGPVMLGHGDLHVGQLLRSAEELVVTDFDGNPVVPPSQRLLPQPAALDVAGMAQSLTHAAYVLARHHPDLPRDAVHAAGRDFSEAFTAAYAARLDEQGLAHLFRPRLVPGLRLRQVCREFSYAAEHLPRWTYVPEAALAALLPDQETAT